MQRFFGLFIIGLLVACAPEGEKTVGVEPFFDLKGFIEKESMRTDISKFEKTVIFNNEEEVITVDYLNLEEELTLFKRSDISKPSWSDKYEVTKTENQVVYTAQETKLKTRKLTVNYNEDIVQSLEIINEVNGTAFKTEQHLIYDVKNGYSIDYNQKILISDQNTSTVKVRFL